MELALLLRPVQILDEQVELHLGLLLAAHLFPRLVVDDLVAAQLVDLHAGGALLQLHRAVENVVVGLQLLEAGAPLGGVQQLQDVVLVLFLVDERAVGGRGRRRAPDGPADRVLRHGGHGTAGRGRAGTVVQLAVVPQVPPLEVRHRSRVGGQRLGAILEVAPSVVEVLAESHSRGQGPRSEAVSARQLAGVVPLPEDGVAHDLLLHEEGGQRGDGALSRGTQPALAGGGLLRRGARLALPSAASMLLLSQDVAILVAEKQSLVELVAARRPLSPVGVLVLGRRWPLRSSVHDGHLLLLLRSRPRLISLLSLGRALLLALLVARAARVGR